MQIIEEDKPSLIARTIWRWFGDAWLTMIAAGALGHQRHIGWLLTISYWNMWLIIFIVQGLGPVHSFPKLFVKDSDK